MEIIAMGILATISWFDIYDVAPKVPTEDSEFAKVRITRNAHVRTRNVRCKRKKMMEDERGVEYKYAADLLYEAVVFISCPSHRALHFDSDPARTETSRHFYANFAPR